ncbi:MAG: energy transducer TonB [Acidobacteria bacterium]|jgi:protein TonB|nr:MAG: energy transducer TonB [Acidobacteriota bacterium]
MDRAHKVDRLFRAYSLSLLIHLFLLLAFLLLPRTFWKREKLVLQIDLHTIELGKEVSKAQESIPEQKSMLPQEPLKSISQRIAQASPSTPEISKEHEKPSEEDKAQAPDSTAFNTIQHFEALTTPEKESPPVAQVKIEKEAHSLMPNKKEESPEALREAYIKERLLVISSIVQKNISYPSIARRMGWEGRVVVMIHINKEGSLEGIRVEQSSGYEVLDRNAIETVKRVSYLFPKPPVDVVVKLPVNYRLE